MVPRIADEIPHNQEIVHIAHGLDDGKLIFQALGELRRRVAVMLHQPFVTELVQIFPGGVLLRNIKFRQLGHAELDLHMTALGNFPGVFQSLLRVRKEGLHLLRRLHIILAALVAHPVLILKFFSSLEAEQNIVGRRILGVGVMDVVGGHEIDAELLAHPKKLRVHHFLLRNAMILKLQEKVSFSKGGLVFLCRPAGLLVHAPGQIALHLARQAGA